MRWDVAGWAAVALLLFAAETMAPGAFMLWMGFAAVVVFLGVLVVPGIPLLAQVAAFVVLSFVSIRVYQLNTVWGRGAPASTRGGGQDVGDAGQAVADLVAERRKQHGLAARCFVGIGAEQAQLTAIFALLWLKQALPRKEYFAF